MSRDVNIFQQLDLGSQWFSLLTLLSNIEIEKWKMCETNTVKARITSERCHKT